MDKIIGNAPGPGSTIGIFGAQKVCLIEEELIAAGKAFSYEDYLTFGANEIKTIIFDSSAFNGPNLTFKPFIFGAKAGPFKIDFYTGATCDPDGTILACGNRCEWLQGPKSILRLNPNNISLGTRLAGDTVLATGMGAGNVNPSGNLPSVKFGIDYSKNHGLTILNTNGADILFQIKWIWFEY